MSVHILFCGSIYLNPSWCFLKVPLCFLSVIVGVWFWSSFFQTQTSQKMNFWGNYHNATELDSCPLWIIICLFRYLALPWMILEEKVINKSVNKYIGIYLILLIKKPRYYIPSLLKTIGPPLYKWTSKLPPVSSLMSVC